MRACINVGKIEKEGNSAGERGRAGGGNGIIVTQTKNNCSRVNIQTFHAGRGTCLPSYVFDSDLALTLPHNPPICTNKYSIKIFALFII